MVGLNQLRFVNDDEEKGRFYARETVALISSKEKRKKRKKTHLGSAIPGNVGKSEYGLREREMPS